jgi:hypothetical protein
VVWDQDSAVNSEIYINGAAENATDTGTISNVDAVNAGSLRVGSETDSGNPFEGMIDDVRIYNFAFTPAQAKVVYSGGASQVLGAISTDGTGPASWAASAEYCPPGDPDTCNPPIAEWRFDEYGGTSANDTSENSNTGTITNADWDHGGNCAKGTCLYFDGTGTERHVDAGSDTSLDDIHDDAFSVEAWIKADSYGADDGGYIVSKAESDGGWRFNLGSASVNGLVGRVDCNTTDARSTSGTDEFTADGKWHHVAMTYYDAGDRYVYLYIDGREVESYDIRFQGVDPVETDVSDNLIIGNNDNDDSDYVFNGNIDDIRIYDYVRTPAQIAWSYNKGGPVGWWRFDECSGTTAYDSGSGDNNGTITIGSGGGNTSAGTCEGSSSEAWANGSSGKINYSLDFDNNDDYVDMGDIIDLSSSDDLTLSGWFNRDTATSDDTVIAKRSGVAAGDTGYIVYIDDANDTVIFEISDGTDEYQLESSTTLTSTGWNHFAVVWDQDSASASEIYINGKDDDATDTGTIGNVDAVDTGNLRVGTETDGDNPFDGQIDEVKVWNYALTSEQVKIDYTSGAARFN